MYEPSDIETNDTIHYRSDNGTINSGKVQMIFSDCVILWSTGILVGYEKIVSVTAAEENKKFPRLVEELLAL